MMRRMLGVTLMDRRSNSWLHERLKMRDARMVATRRKWFFAKKIVTGGETWAKKIVEWRPWEKKRSVGRPRARWRDDFRSVLGENWSTVARNNKELFKSTMIQQSLFDYSDDPRKDKLIEELTILEKECRKKLANIGDCPKLNHWPVILLAVAVVILLLTNTISIIYIWHLRRKLLATNGKESALPTDIGKTHRVVLNPHPETLVVPKTEKAKIPRQRKIRKPEVLTSAHRDYIVKRKVEVAQEKEENITIEKVYYDEKLNEIYDIGTDVDLMEEASEKASAQGKTNKSSAPQDVKAPEEKKSTKMVYVRGINIDEKVLTNLRYADDIVLFSSPTTELSSMLNDLERSRQEDRPQDERQEDAVNEKPLQRPRQSHPGGSKRAGWAAFNSIKEVTSQLKDPKLRAHIFEASIIPAIS
ncbi:unnamed protein product [Caenorhabditis auriculariae]|uniref:Reverse transcriptase domain-containing protein n=1 Tax=Caenorhabditis auriculariae TaxID=2777116 RepID=A0A8S1HJX3_9PELO|nr:unnamed protein product [Caenorhabditis auriculariae]